MKRVSLNTVEEIGCCGECLFWDRFPSDKLEASIGKCRRFPPTTDCIQEKTCIGPVCHLPVTRVGDWCGEFRTNVRPEESVTNGKVTVRKG